MSGSFEVPTLKHTGADPESQAKTIESVTIPKVQLKSAGADPESQPKHIESVTIPKVALKSARRPADYDGSVANVSSNYEANKENPFGAVKLRGGNRPADFDGSVHNVAPKTVESTIIPKVTLRSSGGPAGKTVESATLPTVQLKSAARPADYDGSVANVTPKVSESSAPLYDVSSLKPTAVTV